MFSEIDRAVGQIYQLMVELGMPDEVYFANNSACVVGLGMTFQGLLM
jgi:hypothetical protein